jgi:hypothetical protein
VIPGSVKKLIEMGERERGAEKKRSENEGKECCQACGKENERENLSRCRGCESVWYCDKVRLDDCLILSKLMLRRDVKQRAGMRRAIRGNAKFTGQ